MPTIAYSNHPSQNLNMNRLRQTYVSVFEWLPTSMNYRETIQQINRLQVVLVPRNQWLPSASLKISKMAQHLMNEGCLPYEELNSSYLVSRITHHELSKELPMRIWSGGDSDHCHPLFGWFRTTKGYQSQGPYTPEVASMATKRYRWWNPLPRLPWLPNNANGGEATTTRCESRPHHCYWCRTTPRRSRSKSWSVDYSLRNYHW